MPSQPSAPPKPTAVYASIGYRRRAPRVCHRGQRPRPSLPRLSQDIGQTVRFHEVAQTPLFAQSSTREIGRRVLRVSRASTVPFSGVVAILSWKSSLPSRTRARHASFFLFLLCIRHFPDSRAHHEPSSPWEPFRPRENAWSRPASTRRAGVRELRARPLRPCSEWSQNVSFVVAIPSRGSTISSHRCHDAPTFWQTCLVYTAHVVLLSQPTHNILGCKRVSQNVHIDVGAVAIFSMV